MSSSPETAALALSPDATGWCRRIGGGQSESGTAARCWEILRRNHGGLSASIALKIDVWLNCFKKRQEKIDGLKLDKGKI